MALEITEVRVRPYDKSNDKLKAFATITFNNCFIVTDLKVIRGKKGLFVAMPSRKRKDGQFKDVAHPLNTETRQMIEQKVLAAYEESLEHGISAANKGEDDIPADLEDELTDK
jgi:stage V sporulation protein G